MTYSILNCKKTKILHVQNKIRLGPHCFRSSYFRTEWTPLTIMGPSGFHRFNRKNSAIFFFLWISAMNGSVDLALHCTEGSHMFFIELDMTIGTSLEPQLPAISKATAKLKILSLITVNKEGISPFIHPKSFLRLHFKRLAFANLPYTLQ